MKTTVPNPMYIAPPLKSRDLSSDMRPADPARLEAKVPSRRWAASFPTFTYLGHPPTRRTGRPPGFRHPGVMFAVDH